MLNLFKKSLFPVFYLFLGIVLLVSCKSGTVKEQPVSSAEARIYSEKLKQSVTKGRGKFIDETIQSAAFYNRILMGGEGSARVKLSKNEFKRLFSEMRLGQRISEGIGNNGTFEEIRAYVDNNKHHLVYRAYAEDGMNYYDFELSKINGKVVIADIFVYLTGQLFSETARELVVQIINSKGNTSANEKQQAEKIKEMRQLIQAEKYKEVIDIVDGLPASLKKVRVFLLQKLLAASRYDVAEFEKAKREFEQYFPGERDKMGLMLLDGYVLQGKMKEALKCINDLDKQLGRDPLLDLQRGVLYYQDNQHDSAIYYLERLAGNMPNFSDGNTQLVNVLMLTGNQKKAKDLLEEYKIGNRITSKALQSLEESFPSLAK